MHSARILSDITANRTRDLAGRIGRIIETVILHRARDGEVRDAGLNNDQSVSQIDVENPFELRHPQQHAVRKRQRATGKRSTRSTRYDLHALGMATGQYTGNLIHRLRQHDNHRRWR